MLFNSFEFILFFAVAVITYYLLPRKVQNLWLLILNYFFYMYFRNTKRGSSVSVMPRGKRHFAQIGLLLSDFPFCLLSGT